jgi:hypothetical protein
MYIYNYINKSKMDNMFIIIVIIVVIIFLYIIKTINKNTCKSKDLFASSNKTRLSVMAIFKNEELYLEEWLQYHIKEGINHFYLYSNDENMEKYKFLDKYQDKITLIPWINIISTTYSTVQRDAYTHCIKNYINEYDFLLMLDIDEFIVPLLKNKKVIDIVNKLDKNKVKAVKIQRYNFGSDGHIKKPLGNVMQNYKKHEKICSSYKAMANSKYIDTMQIYYGVHDHPYTDEEGIVYNSYFKYDEDNDNNTYIGPNSCTNDSINEIPLVINHYYTKSQEEYLNRCKLWVNGGINSIGFRTDCKDNFKEKDVNDIEGYEYIKQAMWYKYV